MPIKIKLKKIKLKLVIFTVFILFVVGLSLTAYIFSKNNNHSNNPARQYNVSYDSNGFHPESQTIRVGDTVTFSSKDKQFWTASNIHPTHSIYPQFDPKQPIEPGQTWSFTFDKVGKWRYHDHLAPSFVGTITVLDKDQSKANTSNLATECDKYEGVGQKQKCWDGLIDLTLKTKGLEAAFDTIATLYTQESEFASNCHGYTHKLGVAAYKLFSQHQDFNLTSKASYCGFGFYHAFMETLLRTNGDLNQAREFCNYISQKNDQNELSRLSCFHGIGRGLLEDVPNPSLKGDTQAIIAQPLQICAQVAKSEVEEYRCASGVFNVLAIYYQNPQTDLKVKNNDPYQICASQFKRNVQLSCYDQMNSLVLSLSKGNLPAATKFVQGISDDQLAAEAMHGVAGAYGQNNVGKVSYDDTVKICKSLPTRLEPQCLEGFLLGMIEGGKPGEEHLEATRFCSSQFLNEDEKVSCFDNLVWNVSTNYPKKLVEVCSSLDSKYRKRC